MTAIDLETLIETWIRGEVDGPRTQARLFGTAEAAQATYDHLIGAKQHLDAQFAARKADFEALRNETWESGDTDRYHAKRREYETWKARAVGFSRALESKIREAKAALRARNEQAYAAAQVRVSLDTVGAGGAPITDDVITALKADPSLTDAWRKTLLRTYGQAVNASALERRAIEDASSDAEPGTGTEQDERESA